MNSMKQRLTFGVLFGGILLAATMTPAQAVLAASNNTPSNTNTATNAAADTTTSPTVNKVEPAAHSGGSSAQQNPPQEQASSSDTQPTGSNNAPSSQNQSDTTAATNTDPTTTSSSAGADQPSTNNLPQSQSADPLQNDQGNTNNGDIATNTQSSAQSGNVSAKGNASVGSVASGNASDTITQVTTLNSSTSLDAAGGLQTFTYDIDGDHVGDIALSPADFLQTSAATATQNPQNADITNQTNGTITNTVNASATSGDVAVAGNGSAGDAASGNAATEANLINMIDSVVSDKQAFVGTININGNLKGNLLLPQSAINALLPTPSRDAAQTTNGTNTTTNANNMNVHNNITLNAQSGNVTVTGNGSIGNVTSGNASTNVQLYNLTNSAIVGGNVLLVFVNVMGSWVGLLMNAPAGTTSAALGGSITQDSTVANDTTTSTTSNETITNNVNLNSQSGNVAVKGNQSTGNTTSGNASANADIVNILGSQVDLTGWLGVLIINVYGSWTGSLEIEPAAVTLHVAASAVHKPVRTPLETSGTAIDPRSMYNLANSMPDASLAASNVLGAATTSKPAAGLAKHAATLTNSKNHTSAADLIAAAIGVLLIGAIATARAFSIRRKKIAI